MKKNVRRALLFVGTVALQLSCNSVPGRNCEKRIKEKIYPGLSAEIAESEPKKCGFKTTMDPKATQDPTGKTLYGDKSVGSPVSERTQVSIKLDSDNKVAGIVVTTGLVGP